MKNTKKITFFFFFTSLAFSSGASTVRFENITLEHGLSQSIINVIHKDSKGFMWFGTEDGLNKYNGYSFQVYKHDPFDTTTISNNSILCIAENEDGNLWVGFLFIEQ